MALIEAGSGIPISLALTLASTGRGLDWLELVLRLGMFPLNFFTDLESVFRDLFPDRILLSMVTLISSSSESEDEDVSDSV